MSNFAAVQQANGTNVIMPGQIVEFKGEGVGRRSGKPWKKVVVEDMERERHTVTVRGNLPNADALNKPAQFTLSTYDGTTYQGQPYVGYSGFCDIMPDYGQPNYGQPAPSYKQPQQQGPPAPPLRQPAPQTQYPRQQQQAPKKAPDWDAKDERIVRQNTLNRSVELYLHTANPEAWPIDTANFTEICSLAELFRDYVYGGIKQAPRQTPRQTMKEAINDVEAYRDAQQAQINAEQDASDAIERGEPPF